MDATRVDEFQIVVLRPHSRILLRSLIAFAAGTIPVFLTAYWFAAPSGLWPLVLAIQIALVGTALVAITGLLQTRIELRSEGVRERGYLGRVSKTSRTDVTDALLLDIFDSQSSETRKHLFVRGSKDELMLRMRGHFWSVEQMELVVRHLRVPVSYSKDPITLAELRAESPGLVYWFERW